MGLERFVPIVHIVTAVMDIIELGLTAYVASGFIRAPDQVNFMVFNSVWSLLVLVYIGLSPLYFAQLFHRLVALGLLAVTTIFWFAGSIALATLIGAPRCGNSTICGSEQAAVAFGFFIWVAFTFLLVLEILEFLRSRGHSTPQSKPTTATGPTYPGV